MDRDINDKNVALYNRHANRYTNQNEAISQRAKGTAAPLKKLHNKIKRLVIQRFAAGADRLLDLACGRGGDLQKWIDCNIKYVKGYDIAAEEVKEARARLKQRLSEDPTLGGRFAADFEATDRIGAEVWEEAGGTFDCVTCMFALHYFFHSEASADAAVALAARNLRPGGHFVGVLPDGKQVLAALGPGMVPVELKQLRLAPCWQGSPAPFGSAYTCALTDTVTEGGDAGEGSREFLVYQSVLAPLAARHGLAPLADYGDFELDELLGPPERSSNGTRLFRRFRAHFPGSHPSLMLASQLNAAFAFVKVAPGEPVDLSAAATAAPPPRAPEPRAARHGDDDEDDDGGGEAASDRRAGHGPRPLPSAKRRAPTEAPAFKASSKRRVQRGADGDGEATPGL